MKPSVPNALTLTLTLFVFACGTSEDASTSDASTQQQDAGTSDASTQDAGEQNDLDAGEDAGTTPDSGTEGDPNDQAVGTWNLTGSAACNLSFSGAWQGERVSANEFGFRITKSEQELFNCTIRATDTTKFTCSNVNVGGPIAPGSQCTANYSFTDVSGTFAGDAVELTATIQVTSPTCGQALNCGPSMHNASGTIAR